MNLNASDIWDRLNSTYWFVPVLMTLGAVAAVIGAVLLDRVVSMGDGWIRFLYPHSLDGARTLLSSATGSIVTVVSVTFSVTVVALTVASQHFGPRVLDNFIREGGSKVVLGIFIGTFVYCMILLSAIGEAPSEPFVPAIALIGAVALMGTSVAALIYFVHHVAHSIQIPHITRRIGRDLEASVARVFNETDGEVAADTRTEAAPADAATVVARRDGYVQRIDEERLVALAERADARIWVRRRPGEFVIAGTALAAVSPPAALEHLPADAVNDAHVLGQVRSTREDPSFAIDKLVEVALRALSPAVNEPFTALTSIDRLGSGLARAAARRPRTLVRHGANGWPRVYLERYSFQALLRSAFDPIRVFAGENPAVYVRVFETLAMLSETAARPDYREALRHQAEAWGAAADERLTHARDRAGMDVAFQRAVHNLA